MLVYLFCAGRGDMTMKGLFGLSGCENEREVLLLFYCDIPVM